MTRKTLILSAVATTLIAVAAVLLLSLRPDDGIMQKKGNSYIVTTTKLTPKVRGYAGTVPLQVTITSGKIQSIKALPNRETPEFFDSAKRKIFQQYTGKTVKQALSMRPDVLTGATYSSGAIISNVHAALKYYEEHK